MNGMTGLWARRQTAVGVVYATNVSRTVKTRLTARESDADTPDSPASAMNGEFTSYNDHK